ncbi:hypothetical protein NW752_006912 [Fusarium irregulare]|uniref:DNA2/NAM7 helicase-like C-terminal domain-containing protein n=1 Tax=Fusarium irregulare TaxID=2494466 RepID=A0A9W8UB65_9HYPO|nr:hypothetical protein NW766_005792 [Fusarium irregulare]KAJ4015979.1 hypothetical protein NW752_006912 [Fusarium irregulare]
MAATQLKCTLLIPPPSGEGASGAIPSDPESQDVFVNLTHSGIKLSFPRDPDRGIWTWYSPDLALTDSNMHHIMIELPSGGFQTTGQELVNDETKGLFALAGQNIPEIHTVKFTLKENYSVDVIGFGTPFHGANATVDSWINEGAQICGVASLDQVLRATEFTLLVPAPKDQIQACISSFRNRRKDPGFGFGDTHTWDMDRYAKQIPKLRGYAFPPQIRFDNANERDTALTQMHVQDKVGEEPYEKTKQFVCLLEPSEQFQVPHWRAARRALKGNASKLVVTFKSPKYAAWEAFHLTFSSSDHLAGVDCDRRLPLLLTRPEEKQPGHDFTPFSYPNYKATDKTSKRNIVTLQCQTNLHGEERRVSAINRLSSLEISPSSMATDSHAFIKQAVFNELLVGKGLWSLQKQGINVQTPTVDLLDGIPADIKEACLDHVFQDDRERVQQYFGKLHLGLGLVSGPPGTGKSHLAAILVVAMCFNSSIQHVYVTAASNDSTDNILDRIDAMAQEVTGKLQGHAKHLMALRGYSLNIEAENCTMSLLGKPFKEDTIWTQSPWRFELSLCWWTLRALGANGVPPLTVDDNSELWDLHQKLNKVVSSPSSYPGLSAFHQLVKLARGIEPASSHLRLETQDSYRKALNKLMGLVVECANVVATTPGSSASWIYRSFNDTKARAVVFDEAATLFCSDALMVYGNTPRPMVAIGDPKQLAPNLATAFELRHGNRSKHDRRIDSKMPFLDRLRNMLQDPIPTNRFAKFAQISWLSWFIYLGWPVFHLYTQHRMAEGLFDLSLNTVYQGLKPHFKYSPLCNPVNFSLGLRIEEFLKAEYHIPSGATLQPVFFDCKRCPCREWLDSLSRLNPRQADVIATFLVKMVKTLNLSTQDIVVLTPYRANLGAIGRRFRKENVLRNITLSTFNRFQGREAQIVILALCVDISTGPLFVAEERSLNVALTRQRSGLLIFGDINTPRHTYDRDPEFGETRLDDTMIKSVFSTISSTRRVVTLHGDEKVDPDRR